MQAERPQLCLAVSDIPVRSKVKEGGQGRWFRAETEESESRCRY